MSDDLAGQHQAQSKGGSAAPAQPTVVDDCAAGPAGSRGTEVERVAEWRERCQCRRVQYADRDQQPCALRRQISQSDQRRRGRAKRQEDFRSIQTIRQPGYCLSSHQPHRRTSGQRQRDRLRTQVAIVEQNWQVRRLDAEPRIERAVEIRNRYNTKREELIIRSRWHSDAKAADDMYDGTNDIIALTEILGRSDSSRSHFDPELLKIPCY